MSRRTVQTPIWLAAIAIAAALAVGGLAGQMTRGGPVFTVAAATPDTDTRPGVGMRSSFAPIVKLAAPSVVNIWSSRVVKNNESNNPFLQDPFFRQFFGNQHTQ